MAFQISGNNYSMNCDTCGVVNFSERIYTEAKLGDSKKLDEEKLRKGVKIYWLPYCIFIIVLSCESIAFEI
jgi:hypothetical protein